jgi:peptidoglycan/xylan/chitin deacetylase (PgdA/CDA1 family)
MLAAKLRTAGLLAGVLLLLLPSLARAANPSTTVSLTFDNGLSDQYTYALPALSSHGMQGTFYIITGLTETSSAYMTWAELHAMAGAGNEIAGHTVLHDKLTTLTLTEAAREICNDRVNLINQGFQPTDFAYPNGAFNSNLESIAASCGYDSARTVGGIISPFDGACSSGCPYAEGIPPADPYAVRTPDSVTSTMPLSQIETLVTQAESNGGGWVPIVFHDVCENACSELSISPAEFSAFLDWLKQQQESGALSVKTVQQVIGGSFQPGVPGPPPTGTSLQNPSLENPSSGEGSVPQCWQPGGYGTNTATFVRTPDAHTGSWAEQLTVSNYQSGDAKLVVRQDEGDCAPEVTPGRAYTVSSWYKSTTRMNLVAFYRDQIGAWHYLATSPAFAAAASWTNAQWTTPAMPSTATAISFGPDLTSNGSITFDDLGLAMAPPTVSLTGLINGMVYSGTQTLSANAGTGTNHVDFLVNGNVVGTATSSPWSISWNSQSVPEGPVTIAARAVDANGASSSSSVKVSIDNTGSLIKNASLEWDANGDNIPDCWQTSGYGTNTFSWTRTSDAHSGSWAERVEITSYTSGDRKLLQTQDSGLCAPAVSPGRVYTASTWFKSNVHPYFVAFTRNSSGTWSFWTSSPGFAGSSTEWTQATWKLPPIPAGTTNISYGLDLNTVGFVTVDDFSLS